jgi:hypothetical protein
MFSISALEILPSFNKSLKIACLNAGIKSSAFGDNPIPGQEARGL